MDISKLKPVSISCHAHRKITNDFFPEAEEKDLYEQVLSEREMEIHAGAFALYTTTLATLVHQKYPETIKVEATERKRELKELVKNHSRYSSMSEQEINEMVEKMILRDIRNSFAHGNFKISYSIYTRKLFYVLEPRRKDFVSDKPIVIAKDDLFKANMEQLRKARFKFVINGIKESTPDNLDNFNISELTKSLVVPAYLMRLYQFYLENIRSQNLKKDFNLSWFLLTSYFLQVTKITYEQDEFYNLLNKDSNMFKAVAYLRNSLAHDGVEFVGIMNSIKNTDREQSSTETLKEIVEKLMRITNTKDLIVLAKDLGYSDEMLEIFANDFKQVFDKMYIDDSIELDIFNNDDE